MRVQNIIQGTVKPYTNSEYKRNKFNSPSNITNYDTFNNSSITKLFFKGNLPDNFGIVIDNKLFRGAMPKTIEEVQSLNDKGVTTIIDLCEELNPEWAKKCGIKYVRHNFNDISLKKECFRKVAQLIKEEIEHAEGAVSVSCEYGERRTGEAIAFYLDLIDEPLQKIIDHTKQYSPEQVELIEGLLKRFGKKGHN